MDERSAILVNSSDSRIAMRKLYFLLKSENSKLSLTGILQKTGIPSRGYLSMVLNGKKTLGNKYLSEMALVLRLRPEQKEYFSTMIQIDLSKSEKTITELRNELENLRSKLQVSTREMETKIHDFILFSEVFCSVSLFSSPPTQAEILELFGNDRTIEIQSVLAELVRMGVLRINKANFGYEQIQKRVPWLGSSDPQDMIDVLKQSFSDGIQGVQRHYRDKSSSYFKTGIFSVDFKKYTQSLQLLKESISSFEGEIDSEEADSLVRFNIQVYPATKVLDKKKG